MRGQPEKTAGGFYYIIAAPIHANILGLRMNNTTFLIIIVLLLTVLVAVVAYNIHQENQYRKKIRSQFGHADRDALMQSQTTSVRDGQTFGESGGSGLGASLNRTPAAPKQPEKPAAPVETPVSPAPSAAPQADGGRAETAAQKQPEKPAPAAETPAAEAPAARSQSEFPFELVSPEQPPKPAKVERKSAAKSAAPKHQALDLEDLRRAKLKWFDKRFDYMAYVSLNEPRELHSVPRLSGRHRFQVIGCTMDGRFQAAEPIPGILYQAFVIGLQAVSRIGVAERRDLDDFRSQVERFAAKNGGSALFENATAFLETAGPLDELCARVDQAIAIHLVNQAGVSGNELRAALTRRGFELMPDGSFVLAADTGGAKYTAVTLDGNPFTDGLLSSQPYKGFSLLFDITRVPASDDNFDQFMNLVVAVSKELRLDLVDEKIQPISSQWLKNVRRYIKARQEEMLAVDIAPGGALAKRLFS